MKPIPIAAAKRLAEEYGYDQVVVYARRCGESAPPHGEHLTTYGRTKQHCDVAARMGDTLKKLMGWETRKDQWADGRPCGCTSSATRPGASGRRLVPRSANATATKPAASGTKTDG